MTWPHSPKTCCPPLPLDRRLPTMTRGGRRTVDQAYSRETGRCRRRGATVRGGCTSNNAGAVGQAADTGSNDSGALVRRRLADGGELRAARSGCGSRGPGWATRRGRCHLLPGLQERPAQGRHRVWAGAVAGTIYGPATRHVSWPTRYERGRLRRTLPAHHFRGSAQRGDLARGVIILRAGMGKEMLSDD